MAQLRCLVVDNHRMTPKPKGNTSGAAAHLDCQIPTVSVRLPSLSVTFRHFASYFAILPRVFDTWTVSVFVPSLSGLFQFRSVIVWTVSVSFRHLLDWNSSAENWLD